MAEFDQNQANSPIPGISDEIVSNNSAKLHFSNDTIKFDTVFTSIGSITKTF